MAGIYMHVPFCRRRCHYCDFYFTTNTRLASDFVHRVCQEMEQRSQQLAGETIETIYVGGGTPSTLTAGQLNTLFNRAASLFHLGSNPEITLEANPEDLSSEYLKELGTTPVNRLSIGIQSFDNRYLQWMNRMHTARQAITCITEAAAAGIHNLSIDLIYGLPALDEATWLHQLQQVSRLPVNHLSAYCLTVEPRTPLARHIKDGKTIAPDDDRAARHFDMLMDWAAQAGFEHYEISNLSKPACHSRHNTAYWQGIPYLGLGPSAHSYVQGQRQANNFTLAAYLQGNTCTSTEQLSPANLFNEYVLTRLRTAAGIHLSQAAEQFPAYVLPEWLAKVHKLMAGNYLQQHSHRLTLTRQGRHFADWVAARLFA